MHPDLRLDVLIPTYNRASLLEKCVRSVLNARTIPWLSVHITVICNGCTDASAELVRRLQVAFPRRISLVEERRRGKSHALNIGIASTGGDLVGMIDDDEQVDASWLEVVAREFLDTSVDFVGGPYSAVWPAPAPPWMPPEYLAVLGSVDNGPECRTYDASFPGMLKGGNAVIRRDVLLRVGPYAEYLGPSERSRLFSCEDEDMYWRLLKAGAHGRYLPDLVIYHYISEERLSQEYYRSWCFWRGVSRGLMDRTHPLPVTYLAGIPRFLWGEAVRGLARLTVSRRRAKGETFGDELKMWDVAGYLYGKHVYPLARFSPVRSRRLPTTPTFAELERHSRNERTDVEMAG